MFPKLFIRILTIFLMISLGALARRLGFTTPETSRRLARLTVSFFYPSLIFYSIFTNYTWAEIIGNWSLPAGAFMIMSLGYLAGLIFSHLLPFDSKIQRAGFQFQCTINNYSFLPLPIALMLWGNPGMARLLFSTLGSEIAVWTLGILALAGTRLNRQSWRFLLNPPLLALLVTVLAVAFRNPLVRTIPAGGFTLLKEVGHSLLTVLDMFGRATIPLSMFVAGSRMADLKPAHLFTRVQFYVVTLRLVAIPAVCIALLMALPLLPDIRSTLVLLATMPSAIASVALSEIFDGDPEFAASSVLLTHFVSLLTIPAWLAFLV